MNTVYTNDLIRYLARTRGRSQSYYRQALADVLDGVTEQLTYGHRVQLIGFGSFYTREQPAGTVKSILTGRPLDLPARRVAAFRVGEVLKRAVRQKPVGRPPKGIGSSVTSALGSLLRAPRMGVARRAVTERSRTNRS